MENNKKVLIGISVLAIAGIGFYFWKKNKDKDDALKKIQKKINEPVTPQKVAVNTDLVEAKSSFTGEVIAHKCSCTGKQLEINADKEVMEKFHSSCLKNGGMIIDIKSK